MKEKKLMIFLGSLGRGGAERVISILSEHFRQLGWNVQIGLLLFNTVDYDIHPDIEIIDLTGNTQSRAKRAPMWIREIRKLVKRENPDMILSFAARINVLVMLACLGLKKQIVVSERNDPYCDGRSKGVDMLTNWLYPKAKKVVFQTKRAQGYFKKLKNGTIIGNPIVVKTEASENCSEKIVTMGRLTPQKNQKILVDVFSRISKVFPELTLEIYGDGELKEDLQKQIDSLGLTEKVLLMGNHPDVHDRIKDAKLFVLSSDYEGLSNALLEAMMMGLPVVSTDCAGSDEAIEDGVSGKLVPVGDAEALTKAISDVLSDEQKRKTLADGAKEASKAFTTDVVMTQWEKVLD
ncbi:MAG: glycosyltransferase family 4 protein [Clostridia bacterium]|nr:glycosyltransferase family 4 protein [Clostridia bacterium]